MNITVFHCPRSNYRAERERLADVKAVEVPCVGRVSTALMLAELSQTADGVLVLGRSQETCRMHGAEDPARRRCESLAQVLALTGLPGRVAFVDAGAGPHAAAAALETFASDLKMFGPLSRPATVPAELLANESVESALSLLALLANGSLSPQGASAAWCGAHGLPPATTNGSVLFLGDLAWAEWLAPDLLRPLTARAVAASAVAVAKHLGIDDVGVALTGGRVGRKKLGVWRGAKTLVALGEADVHTLERAELRCQSMERLCAEPGLAKASPGGKVACRDGMQAFVTSLGFTPVVLGPDPLPPHLALTAAHRQAACAQLEKAFAAGAAAVLVPGIEHLVRMAMLLRQGAWRTSRVQPLLPHQLAWHAIHGVALAQGAGAASQHSTVGAAQ